MRRYSVLLAVAVASTFAGCGGESDTGPQTVVAPAAQPSPSTPTPPPTPASAQPQATPTSTPDAAGAALAAALKRFDGVPEATCRTSANPQRKSCVSLSGQAQSPERGIVLVGVSDPQGAGGFIAVMARDSAGEWKLWFGTQNVTYRLIQLPDDLIVCTRGQGLNLRSAPSTSATVVVTLNDLDKLRAEEFVLTEPTPRPEDNAGYGWYRVSSPRAGWVYSKYVSDARLGDCGTRNLTEKD